MRVFLSSTSPKAAILSPLSKVSTFISLFFKPRASVNSSYLTVLDSVRVFIVISLLEIFSISPMIALFWTFLVISDFS